MIDKASYITAVSSIWPIDITASLVAGVAGDRRGRQILVNEAVELPVDPEHRRGNARAAIPSARWTCDDEGTWRLKFLPLDGLETTTEMAGTLVESAHTYADIFTASGANKSHADSMVQRAKRAAGTYDSGKNWARFTAALIEHIFREANVTDISTSLYGRLKRKSVWSKALASTFREIAIRAEQTPGCPLVADRGGALVICHKGNQYEYGEAIASVDHSLTLRGDHAPDITIRKADFRAMASYIQSVKGPVEVQVLSQIGSLPHLPWYCRRTEDETNNSPHREWIRPIVVADSARTPNQTADVLDPSGYSLVDYVSACDYPLLPGITGVSVQGQGAVLRELGCLSRQLPAIRQKAQKSQSGVRGFRASEETHWIGALREDSRRYSSKYCTFGDDLLYMIAVLTCIRSLLSKGPSTFPLAAQHLQSQGFIRANQIAVDVVITECRGALERAAAFLRQQGDDQRRLKTVIGKFHHGCLELQGMRDIVLGGVTGRELRTSGLGYLIVGLRSVADAYFGWQLFLLATLLKASVWPMYLIWGANLPKAISGMLARRGKTTFLSYQPQAWRAT